MREINRSISFMVLVIFFTTVVLGGGGWGEERNKGFLNVEIPKRVKVEETFKVKVGILMGQSLKISWPEGFVPTSSKPMLNIDGEEIYEVSAPKKAGRYLIEFGVVSPEVKSSSFEVKVSTGFFKKYLSKVGVVTGMISSIPFAVRPESIPPSLSEILTNLGVAFIGGCIGMYLGGLIGDYFDDRWEVHDIFSLK